MQHKKIETLTAENRRLRALNKQLKRRIKIMAGISITSQEATLATGLSCSIDDILEAFDPTPGVDPTAETLAIGEYLDRRNTGMLLRTKHDPGKIYFFRHHIPAEIRIARIERVLWCPPEDENLFRQFLDGTCDFFWPDDRPEDTFENWVDFPEMHDFGLIAFLGHRGDVGRSPVPQDISFYQTDGIL